MATNDTTIRKRMIQLRFYSDNNSNNMPNRRNIEGSTNTEPNVTWRYFCDDASFKDFSPILSFGVQTVPGTKIYFNQSTTPIIIGGTGIYELDLSNSSTVLNSFRVDPESMKIINNLPSGYLIIDIVYSGKGETT